MHFIESLVGHILFFGVFAVLIAMRSKKAQHSAGRKELSYPLALKLLSFLGFGILLVGTSYGVATSEGFERVFVLITMGSISAIAFFGVVEVFATRITYDTNYIYQSSIFSRTHALQFVDVIEVAYSERWSQHLIRDLRGGVVRVSKFMNGAEELIDDTIDRMPNKLETATLMKLSD